MLCQGKENQFDSKYGFVKESDVLHKIDSSFGIGATMRNC